jgi:hypothetical protein
VIYRRIRSGKREREEFREEKMDVFENVSRKKKRQQRMKGKKKGMLCRKNDKTERRGWRETGREWR